MAGSDMPRWDVYPIRNRAKGKLPVAALWGVAPTDLVNVTDGDFDTVTGTGSTVLGAAGQLGRILIDLGAVYNVHLRGKFGLWSTAGNITLFWQYSEDAITYRYTSWVSHPIAYGQAAEYVMFSLTDFVRARYLQIVFSGTVAMTGNVKIYEVQAIDLGI